MIHRALFGSIERFFGVLTEHYAGAFPAWLAPVQVMGIPIRTENIDYLREVAERLRGEGIRVEVDESDDRMQKKILHAQQQKVPFMFVAGPRDVEAGAVSIRYRNGIERRGVPVDDAIVEVARNIASRQVEPDALNPDELVAPDGMTEPVEQPGAGVPDGWQRLWMPERLAYILGEGKTDGCPFCRIPQMSDEDGLIVGARRDGVRRAQPLPVQLRAPDGRAVPARRRLHRADGRARPPRSPR